MIWFSNLLILRVPDKGYSRNALCALNLISTFYYRFFYYIGIRNSLAAVVSIYFRQKKYTWRKTLLWRWEYILNIWFCTFSFGHCVVCSSSIYGFWLPLWYLQTLLLTDHELPYIQNTNRAEKRTLVALLHGQVWTIHLEIRCVKPTGGERLYKTYKGCVRRTIR